jgi:hypothetical protein
MDDASSFADPELQKTLRDIGVFMQSTVALKRGLHARYAVW